MFFVVSEYRKLCAAQMFDCMPDAIDWIIDTAHKLGANFVPELSDDEMLWFRDCMGWLQWVKVIEVKL